MFADRKKSSKTPGADAPSEGQADRVDLKRRDILLRSPEVVVLAAVSALWPMFTRVTPPRTAPKPLPVKFDIGDLAPGEYRHEMAAGYPIFIGRLTPSDLNAEDNFPLDQLKDANARNVNRPRARATLANRLVGPDLLVMHGICTHLGCVPLTKKGDFGGWFCPCHGSHYDKIGRIRKGPAPENMAIPKVAFIDDRTIQIG